MKILSYRQPQTEYNLQLGFKDLILRAFKRHPTESMEQISKRLGISETTLYGACREWKIERVKLNEVKNEL